MVLGRMLVILVFMANSLCITGFAQAGIFTDDSPPVRPTGPAATLLPQTGHFLTTSDSVAQTLISSSIYGTTYSMICSINAGFIPPAAIKVATDLTATAESVADSNEVAGTLHYPQHHHDLVHNDCREKDLR